MSTLYGSQVHPSIFPKICRICFCEGENKIISEYSYGDKNIFQLLSTYVPLHVDLDNILPQKMCQNCIDELVRVHSFIEKCKVSYNLLRTACNDKNIMPGFEWDDDKEDTDYELSDSNLEEDDHCDDEDKRTTRSGQKSTAKSDDYKCRFCAEVFLTPADLRTHRREANHTRRLNKKCEVCGKACAGAYLLKQHMRTHTKEKPYQCDVCSVGFSNGSNLRRHKRIHSGERPHICDTCGKAFTQSSVLNEHKMIHTGEKPYMCCYCGKAFRAYANYKTHLTRHKIENGELAKEEQLRELEDHQCKVCERVLSTKGALKMHMLIHGDKMFLCTHCGKGFVNKGGLRSHSRVHSGERPFKCRYCGKLFRLQGSLKQHELIHTGQKPYPCKLCPKAFVQHHQLQYHMRTHSGERPYVCPYCAKSFALNGNLKVHIRTHTGETPYHCPVCDKGFYDSSSMKKHAKAHGDVGVNSETHC